MCGSDSAAPYGAASPERAIDGSGAAHAEALKAAGELQSPVGLDDEVQMIGLDGEMQDAESAAPSRVPAL